MELGLLQFEKRIIKRSLPHLSWPVCGSGEFALTRILQQIVTFMVKALRAKLTLKQPWQYHRVVMVLVEWS